MCQYVYIYMTYQYTPIYIFSNISYIYTYIHMYLYTQGKLEESKFDFLRHIGYALVSSKSFDRDLVFLHVG